MKSVLALVASLALASAAAYAAAPVNPAPAEALSPFGIGSCYTNNRSAEDNAHWVPQMEAIGLHVHRTPDTGWGAVEPEQNSWQWSTLDAQVAYLRQHHFTFGAILAGNPGWNKLDPPGNLPVKNIAGWSSYATHLAAHLRGTVKLYEIWNEPPNGTGRDQTPADYAKILEASYDAIHKVDPTALVGLAAKSVHVNYLEQVIQAGGKDHFDYIVLHPYEVLGTSLEHPGGESVFMHIAPTVRKMLAAQDPAREHVPIIFTELGCDTSKGVDHQADALVKAYAMGITQGITCIEWFEARDGDSGPMGLLDDKGEPRPAYRAMGEMIRNLGEHPKALGWVMLHEKDFGFVFRGPSGAVMVAWAPVGESATMDFGAGAQIVDPRTGQTTNGGKFTLTNAPVIIRNVPDGFLRQAHANLAKPFPWGGDYSQAREVAVNFSERNAERGLHTLAPEAIAHDVTAYGGAHPADAPGGAVFVVDPNFLSYTPTPIEISVTVRRQKADQNAGFKLVYESTDGFKNCGWYTIPADEQWHTMSWKITDDEFVNYWGYNFALNSDGNQYNKYLIKSVTVRRLDR